MCLCACLRTGTQSLYVLVYTCLLVHRVYMDMCIHRMIVSACTHVRGTGQNVSVSKCNHVSAGNTPREVV